MPDAPGESRFTWWNHPLRQAYLWRSNPMYPWQMKLMEEAAKPRSRVCVSTNNEAGKTADLIPLFGLSVMTAFPGATVFSTAGAEEQIRGQLFKYLAARIRPWTSDNRNDNSKWAISESGLWMRAPKVRGLQSKWIGRVPKDALTMEGYHGSWEHDNEGNRVYCPICVIIDEAKSLETGIYEAAYRIDPDWLLVISTPGPPDTPFVEIMDYDTLQDCELGADHAAYAQRVGMELAGVEA